MSTNKDVRRGIVLYLDGKEVVNNITAIEAECRKLVKDQKSMTRGSKEYIEQGKKIRMLKGILAEHNQQLRAIDQTQKMSLSKGVDLFNKYAASITAVVAALTGVVLKLNTFRNLLNEREESKANVKALTGLDDDAIDWMEQKAVELSTTMDESGLRIRQSASEIMEAYMMVGSNKPELLESKEALNAVTVETMRLATASGMSLTKSVDATTTALNQYGASADDASRYVNVLAAGSKFGAANVEQQSAAILKAGTIAANSNISIEELVGTIEMLGEKGIKSEIAGTGLKTFFTRLATGATDTNPKVVGLATALDNLNAKVEAAERQNVGDGTALLKKLFGDEGMQTAMILSQNTEKVNEYTQAVTGTSIAYEQAAINSDTAVAKLDQVRNELNEQGIILMQELNPAITKTLSHLVNWSRYTVTLVRFIADHRSALAMLTTAIALYWVWINKKIILDKLQVLWNTKVFTSTKAVSAALKANPWLAVASAILLVVGALVDYQRNQNKITQSMRSFESINKKVADEYGGQAANIDRLTQMINNNNLSLAIRREKLEELKKIIPDYNAELTDEGTIINNNTEAIKKYLVELEKQIKMKAAEEELEELIKKQRLTKKRLLKEKDEEKNAAASLAGARFAASQQSSSLSTSGTKALNIGLNQSVKQMETLHDVAVKVVRATEGELKELAAAIEDVNKEIASTSVITIETDDQKTGGNGGTGGESEIEAKKRIKKELEEIETAYLKRQNELKQQYMRDETMTQQDYANELEKLELEKLDKQLAIVGLEPDAREKISQKIVDISLTTKQKIESILESITKESLNEYQKQKAELEKHENEELEVLQKALDQKLISVQKYEETLLAIKKKYAEKVKKIEKKRTKEESAAIRLQYSDQVQSIIDDADGDLKKFNFKGFFSKISSSAFEMRQDIQTAFSEDDPMFTPLMEQVTELEEHAREKMEEFANDIVDALSSIGESFADFFTNEETDFGDFMGNILTILLDFLQKQLIATQANAIATILMKDITLHGLVGIAKASAKIVLITAAFETAKGILGGFYTGGYTGGGDWDEPKGVVHSNEFVANRFAVANPAVRPVLDLIDVAQRTGSIDNLSSDDIAAVTGRSDFSPVTVVSSPVPVPDHGSDDEVKFLLIECSRLMKQMRERLKEPLMARTYANGKGGTMEAEELVNKMKRNAQRRR
ncbi:phage tail tape measure protein [Bacteroides sp. 41_26]|uniref:phage tail tape measure protein n=1 Tax=Bacteroides sp. 41_26 TaxID=1896973 RepID=UPI00259C95DE|nr:phage tail tape measure protein [Bacteroides sp. 41_26]